MPAPSFFGGDEMGKLIDLTGQRFGRLRVIERVEDHITSGGRRKVAYHCVCDCGRHVTVTGQSLRSGITKSCGCFHVDSARIQGRKSKRYNRFDVAGGLAVGVTAKGEQFIIDADDQVLIQPYSWYKTNNGYIATRDSMDNLILLHRLIMGVEGKSVIDHINHDTTDNRRENLRISTYSENMFNAKLRSDNSTGATGVHWSFQRGKWQAEIQVRGKTHHLGFFEDIEDAVVARKAGEEKYFGEYSYDNSIASVPRIAV